MGYIPNDLLSRLVGCRLYSVQFVMDYLQLWFDDDADNRPLLSCDIWPEIIIDGVTYREPDLGYGDALRRLIPGTVVATDEATGVGLRLTFDRGALVLHPAAQEIHAEIASLSGFTDGAVMVWRPGEDSFEDVG
jgi:hypothetical protein